MRVITFKRETSFDSGGDRCFPGKKYIVSEGFLEQIKDMDSGNIASIEMFKEDSKKAYSGQDLSGKTLLVWRTGGMGDLCFITPNLRYIKRTFENSRIVFGCGSRFKSGMIGHPHVDKLVSLPIDYELYESADYYIMFEGIIEGGGDAHRVNAYDLFQRRFGFEDKFSGADKRPVLGLSKEHVTKYESAMSKLFERLGGKRPVVGLGVRASHIIRSAPLGVLMGIIQELVNRGIVVNLLGGQDDSEVVGRLPGMDHPLIVHGYRAATDFRDTIAQISLCDAVIGPDSSCVHIAAALDKPIVALYGAFPSHLRVAYYRRCTAFDVRIKCGPCFLHGIETCDYSNEAKEPACMHQHQPEAIAREALILLQSSFGAKTGSERLPVVGQ